MSEWFCRGASVAVLVVLAVLSVLSPTYPRRSGTPDAHLQTSTAAHGKAEHGGSTAKGWSAAELLPRNIVACLSIPDVNEFSKAVGRTGLAEIFADPELQPFFKLISDHIPPDIAALKDYILAFWAGLKPALAGPVVFALLEVNVPGRTLEAALLADVAGRASAVKAFLGMLEVLALNSGCERILLNMGGREVTILRRRAPEGDFGAWTLDGELLIIATNRGALEQILLRRSNPSFSGLVPSLVDSEDFLVCSARSALDGDRPSFTAFINVEKAMADLLGPRAPQWSSRLGLEDWKALGVSGVLGRSVREVVFVRTDRKGWLLRELGGAPTDLSAAEMLPERTLAAAFGRAHGGMLLQWLGWSTRFGLAPFGEELSRRLSELLVHLGVTPEVLSQLARGESAIAFWSAGRVGWFPRVAAVTEVPSAEKLESVLIPAWRKLASALGGRFVEFGAHFCLVDDASVRYPFFTSPAWALVEGQSPSKRFVIASGDASAVKELAEPTGKRLKDNPRWKTLLERLPVKRSSMLYVDTTALVERAFEPYAPKVISIFLPGASRWLPPGSVPAGELLARHLEAIGLSYADDPMGARLDAVTPAGLAITLGACAIGMERIFFAEHRRN